MERILKFVVGIGNIIFLKLINEIFFNGIIWIVVIYYIFWGWKEE